MRVRAKEDDTFGKMREDASEDKTAWEEAVNRGVGSEGKLAGRLRGDNREALEDDRRGAGSHRET